MHRSLHTCMKVIQSMHISINSYIAHIMYWDICIVHSPYATSFSDDVL